MTDTITTEKQLFEKYGIDKHSHSEWDGCIDNWMSVEIYKLQHKNMLPPSDDLSIAWVCDLMDKRSDLKWWFSNVMSRNDAGSIITTSKRLIYRHSEQIVSELIERHKK